MSSCRFALFFALAVSALFPAALADLTLGPYDGRFGAAVAVDGDLLAVGAPDAAGGGRVYIYTRSGGNWNLTQLVGSPYPQAGEQFGASVELYGYFLLVGAPLRDETGTDSGAVFNLYFDGNTWQYATTVVGQDTGAHDHFGHAIDQRDNNLLVGAPGHAAGAGAAYVFNQGAIQWFQQAKLTAPATLAGDAFGSAVAVGPDAAVVGAPTKGPAGAAYAFAYGAGGWTLAGELLPPSGQPFQRVGSAVALDGDVAVIGCPSTDFRHQWTNVYHRQAGTWQYVDTVESYLASCQQGDTGCWLGDVLAKVGTSAPDCPFGTLADADNDCDVDVRDLGIFLAMNPDQLIGETPKPTGAGRAVAVSGGRVVVGAPHERTFGVVNSGSGAARVYDFTPGGYVESSHLSAPDAKYNAGFGAAVTIAGDEVIVGAPDATGVAGVGKVYLFAAKAPPSDSPLAFSTLPVKNPLIANGQTLDLVITIADHPSGYLNDWQLSTLKATTDGQFYQHPLGFVTSPPYSWLTTHPELQYDTFVASPYTYPNLNADDVVSYLQPVVQKPGEFSVSCWFDVHPAAVPLKKFVAARLTVIGGTSLSLSGVTMDNHVGRQWSYALKTNLKCRADIDDDGTVGQSDLGALLASFNACQGAPAFNPLADFDFSGCVDQADLGALLSEWGCSAY